MVIKHTHSDSISVCIATHNGEKYIKEQLESILPQIGESDEIVISDDGSTDNTISVIETLHDKRIRIIRYIQPDNPLSGMQRGLLYASRNFENAMNHAKGNYIFLCDQDDIWYPTKVQKMMEALKSYDIVKHDFSTIDENGSIIELNHYKREQQIKRSWLYLIKTLPFRGCCLAFRSWILEASSPFPKQCLQHDSWIGINAKLVNAKFLYIDQPLLFHRIHQNNVSENIKENSFLYKIRYRLNLIFQLARHKQVTSNGKMVKR